MRRRYFATFHLGEAEGERPTLEAVFDRGVEWIFEPTRGLERPEGLAFGYGLSEAFVLDGDARVRLRSYENDAHDAFGLSFEHPDREEGSVRWRTDLCAATDHATGEVLAAVTLYAGSSDARIAPGELPVSRPRLVRDLVTRFGAHAHHAVRREPREVRDADVDELVGVLTDSDRQLPVVFVSALNANDRPLVSAETLADRLVGIAHVAVATNRYTSFRLSEAIGRSLSTWDGAVRIYWPGFEVSANPYQHTLWTKQDLAAGGRRGFADEVLERVATVALNRVPPAPVRWDELERHISELAIARMREEGDVDELLETYEEVLAIRDREVESLNQEVAELREAAERMRRQADAWRQAYQEARASGEEAAGESQPAPPTTMPEAVEAVGEEFGDRIAFALNAKSELETSPFADVEGFYGALRWLATTFFEAKAGIRPTSDLDVSCREACGFRYRPDQSSTTMGQYPSYYRASWQGEEVELARHLARGSGTDPRHTLRVGFYWDDDERTVVVGYIGQHQRTRAT